MNGSQIFTDPRDDKAEEAVTRDQWAGCTKWSIAHTWSHFRVWVEHQPTALEKMECSRRESPPSPESPSSHICPTAVVQCPIPVWFALLPSPHRKHGSVADFSGEHRRTQERVRARSKLFFAELSRTWPTPTGSVGSSLSESYGKRSTQNSSKRFFHRIRPSKQLVWRIAQQLLVGPQHRTSFRNLRTRALRVNSDLFLF